MPTRIISDQGRMRSADWALVDGGAVHPRSLGGGGQRILHMANMLRAATLSPLLQIQHRFISASAGLLKEKPLPPRPVVPDSDLIETFLKGSGPGGQKINKTSSAVQLKHIPTGLVVKSQETRSRQQNRKLARNILAEKLDELEHGEGSRMAIKAERVRVKKASSRKKSLRKYRALAEGEGKEGSGSDVTVRSGGVEENDFERSVSKFVTEPEERRK
nr:putative peptide chain release factor-like protein, mitochondrial [Quercus suber]